MNATEVYLSQARGRLKRLERDAASLPSQEREVAGHILAEYSLALMMLEITEQELAALRGDRGGPHMRRRRWI